MKALHYGRKCLRAKNRQCKRTNYREVGAQKTVIREIHGGNRV